MWVYNAQSQNIMAVNNRAIVHYGYSREEFLQMRAPDLVVDTAAANNAQHPGAESAIPNLVSQTHRKRNGQDIFVEIAYFPLHFMGREAVLALINDITEQRQHSEALQYRAKHDIVTGRLNRASFSTCVNDAITAAKPADAAFYIIVLGLNEFREINTSLGYMVGDALLKEAGERIHLVAGASPVARVGNDEFAILLEPGTHPTSMLQMLDELLEQVKRPFPTNDTQIQITASIGVAQYPADGQSVGLLLQHANSALFQARQESAGYAFYDAANDHLAPERVLLATQLMRGLNERRFELRYQPKVPLHDGLTYGFEALARWNSPDRGLTSPDQFISVIESSDLIHPFTQWVLNTAIEECHKWHAQGFPVSVAVNISARNLLDLLLPERIKQMLGRHDLAPQFLELEITESSIMSNPERSLNVLNKIHDIGVAVIIDDFGTGYSSLAYLQKLPVDSLKIDRSFIVEMDREDDTRPIINSIIEMAHSLNISVTAEGIESRQIMAKLAGMNCDYAQGYHISEPMAADSVIAWLRQNGPGTQPASRTDEPS
jgi:diguanylate cyclase (GGDEF)-like protein/PAS domain S-box-containing protein